MSYDSSRHSRSTSVPFSVPAVANESVWTIDVAIDAAIERVIPSGPVLEIQFCADAVSI